MSCRLFLIGISLLSIGIVSAQNGHNGSTSPVIHHFNISYNRPKLIESLPLFGSNSMIIAATGLTTDSSDLATVYQSGEKLMMSNWHIKTRSMRGSTPLSTELIDLQSVTLHYINNSIFCFGSDYSRLKNAPLIWGTSSTDAGESWGELTKLWPIKNGKVTTLIYSSEGIIAFFDGDPYILPSDTTRYMDDKFWGVAPTVIFESKSQDNGEHWSMPRIAFRHNTLDLSHPIVVRLPERIGGGMLAIMQNSLHKKLLFSIQAKDSKSWSYPKVIDNSFSGEALGLWIRGDNIQLLSRYDNGDVYLWSSHIDKMHSADLKRNAHFILHTNPSDLPPIITRHRRHNIYILERGTTYNPEDIIVNERSQ